MHFHVQPSFAFDASDSFSFESNPGGVPHSRIFIHEDQVYYFEVNSNGVCNDYFRILHRLGDAVIEYGNVDLDALSGISFSAQEVYSRIQSALSAGRSIQPLLSDLVDIIFKFQSDNKTSLFTVEAGKCHNLEQMIGNVILVHTETILEAAKAIVDAIVILHKKYSDISNFISEVDHTLQNVSRSASVADRLATMQSDGSQFLSHLSYKEEPILVSYEADNRLYFRRIDAAQDNAVYAMSLENEQVSDAAEKPDSKTQVEPTSSSSDSAVHVLSPDNKRVSDAAEKAGSNKQAEPISSASDSAVHILSPDNKRVSNAAEKAGSNKQAEPESSSSDDDIKCLTRSKKALSTACSINSTYQLILYELFEVWRRNIRVAQCPVCGCFFSTKNCKTVYCESPICRSPKNRISVHRKRNKNDIFLAKTDRNVRLIRSRQDYSANLAMDEEDYQEKEREIMDARKVYQNVKKDGRCIAEIEEAGNALLLASEPIPPQKKKTKQISSGE